MVSSGKDIDVFAIERKLDGRKAPTEMNWVRDFTLNQANLQAARTVEDAPAPMRQELTDVFFGIAEQNAGAVAEERLHRIIGQSLGVGAAGQPYGGFRYAVGRDIARVEWPRVYDLIGRLWPEFNGAGLGDQYREGINRVLAAHGSAWELAADGHLQRVLPIAAQGLVTDAFAELSAPPYAPALALFNAARDAYNDRPRRDRDACANVFDAMESVAKIKYNRPNDTFGQVKNHIEQNNLMRPEIIVILTGLNQLRNGNFGHGMAVQFNLTSAETDFTYLSCISAVILLTRTP